MDRYRLLQVLFGLVVLGQASAQQLSFTTIADTTTPNPGGFPAGTGPGTLIGLNTWAVVDGDTVYFQADVDVPNGGTTDGGYFSGEGGAISLYADVFTLVPDGNGVFQGIANRIAAGEGALFFTGRDQGNVLGLYRSDGVDVTELLDEGDASPTGPLYRHFAAGDYQDGTLAFVADNTSFQGGVYHWSGGVFTTLADTTTAKPQGGGNFQYFVDEGVSLDQGLTTFLAIDAGGQGSGIYRHDGSSLSNLFEQGDPTLTPPRTFDRFHSASARDGGLAFMATDDLGNPGVYYNDGSSTVLVADTTTLAPDSNTLFVSFTTVSTAKGRVAFSAQRVDARRGGGSIGGVYLWAGGQLYTLAEGSGIRLQHRGMDGNHIAFGEPNQYLRATFSFPTDLQLQARECQEVVSVGQTLRYELEINNLGPEDASGVMLDAQIGSEASFVDSVPAGLCSDNAGALTCDLSDLAVGMMDLVGIDVLIDAVGDGDLQSTFAVSTSDGDLANGNNMMGENTKIQGDLIFGNDFTSCRI